MSYCPDCADYARDLKLAHGMREDLQREKVALEQRVAELTRERDELKYRLQAWDDSHTEKIADLEREAEGLKIGLRSIEASLGTLDHSAAIDDESKLADHVSAKVTALMREAEGLRRDKDRLDWLETHHVTVTTDDALLFWRSSSRKIRPLREYIDDTREALDAARNAGGEKP